MARPNANRPWLGAALPGGSPMPRRKRARIEVVEESDSGCEDVPQEQQQLDATPAELDDEDEQASEEEEEVVIDDALLALDAPFELRCWHGAVGGKAVRQLHELCAEAFMAFQGRSFWVPADRPLPAAAAAAGSGWAVLERFAADVYAFHTKGLKDVEIDASRSGAEVWVQVRSGGGGAAEPEHEQLKVTIEAGWAPGSEQVVQTADGQGVSIMVPADAQPVRETPFSSRFHFKILDD